MNQEPKNQESEWDELSDIVFNKLSVCLLRKESLGNYEFCLKNHFEKLKHYIFQTRQDLKDKVLGILEESFNDYKSKIIEQVKKPNLGVSDAVNLTSQMIQISKIEKGAEDIKSFVIADIKEEIEKL